ncbi:hypothetical protein BZG01_10615 [Labilibaculum manganireducens]|uniref:Uncharacterized protein n=1 Tax=Labilibaculum manganireducens TaxID=1940525 RepID=A0A2N3I890_9BACT|nr:hypothetical protein [Labilibaculum manganireducens]PKQ66473.1 hypothetical protein BZG01_10615 [Labilibaculum manganireducens]
MKTILITLLVLLNVNSCKSDKYKLIENDDLKSAFIMNSSPTFKGYFYMGSDSDFHYFESRWDLQKDRCFKIRKTDLIVNEPFDFKADELRIDLFDNTKAIFGENIYCKLYIVDK